MSTSSEIAAVLAGIEIMPLISQSYLDTPPLRFDFSASNPEIENIDMTSVDDLDRYIHAALEKSGHTWGLGGYGERRFFYEKSELFKSGDEYRSIHLGLDIWLPAGTAFFAPLPGRVHSFQNNAHFLDYGPTIILEHDINGTVFWTLYGHLSLESLEGLSEGKAIAVGEKFATLGAPPVNGSWPPHVHFQIMGDLEGKRGDYPGVSTPSDATRYLAVCPNPEILLPQIKSA